MESAAERRLFWGTAVAVVVSDVITKLIAEATLSPRTPLSLIGEFVQLRLVYNFFGLAVVALVVLGSMVRSTRPGDRFRLLALALVCGGAAGNLVDRVRSALGVVDFVDIGVGGWRWPTFNVADSAITVGAVALALSLWQEGRAHQQTKEAQAAEP